MFDKDIIIKIAKDETNICAIYKGQSIGDIFFMKIGIDKIMILETNIHKDFHNSNIEYKMIQKIVELARIQNRKIIYFYPSISEIFKRHPEFDDVRLLNTGR